MVKKKTLDAILESVEAKSLPKAEESLEKRESGGKLNLLSRSTRIHTVEQALDHAEVDREAWDVDHYTINSWECAAYDRKADKWTVQPLFQVKVQLKRRIGQAAVKSLDWLFSRHQPPKLPPAKRIQVKKPPHLLVPSFYDAHFGKLAYGAETGTSQDLKIIKKVFANAVEDILAAVKEWNIDEICLPLGNDFLHIDTLANTTTKGTPVDTDGRMSKVFEVAEEAAIGLIETLRHVAPIRVVWVPGNHDEATSFFLARLVSAWFRSVSNDVIVDCDPSYRKYHHYGATLLGFTHGNEEKLDSLPGLMAHERPSEWAGTTCREFHYGHGHRHRKHVRKAELHDDTVDGVVLRMMPALSGTDSWHHRKGFKGAGRAAEVYLYSRDAGYRGHFHAEVRT